MAYVPVRRGFTGPKGKMGEGDPHHIDLQLLEDLPIADRVKAIDAIANQYQSIGREIEFSNAAVSGKRWNPSLDLSDKVQLLNQAAAAHAHSKHPGWQSLDFYVPFKGKSRFDKGAVEDASIFLPAVPGGTVRSNSGGGYGYYSEALDPSGRTVFRIGHGNIDRPEKVGELKVGDAPVSTGAPATLPESSERTEDILKAFLYGAQTREKEKKEPTIQEQLKGQLVSGLISQAMNPMGFLSSYASSNPFLSGQSAATSDYLNGLLG
jgi:hypothetical protein